MSKEQIKANYVAAVQAGQDAALDAALDQMALEQKASDGTLSQADVDAAVTAAIAPLKDQLVQLQAKDDADLAAAQADHQSMQAVIDDTQKKLDEAVAAKTADEALIQGLQSNVDQAKDLIQKLGDWLKPSAPAQDQPSQGQ